MQGPVYARPTLPPELVDAIFSFLVSATTEGIVDENDRRQVKKHLVSCAQVCRLWRETARHYLFKEFSCTLRVEVPSPERNLEANLKLDSLTEFLLASPGISRSVQTLQLDMSVLRHQVGCQSGYFCLRDPESCPVRIFNILHLLPRLEDVSMSNITPYLPPYLVIDRHSFPAVRKLNSLRISFDRRVDNAAPLNKIASILGYFGNVRHLELQDMEIIEEEGKFFGDRLALQYDESLNSPIPPYCTFESISFHNVRNVSPLLLAFANLASIKDLRSLRLGSMFSGGSLGLAKLIRAIGPNLRHLQFRADCTPTVNTLKLGSFISLSSLTIRLPVAASTSSHALADAKVPDAVLSHLPNLLLSAPQTMHSICFQFCHAEGWTSRSLAIDIAIRHIEDVLVELVDHNGLTSVTFEPEQGHTLMAEDEEYLKRTLGRIQERDVLRIG